MGSGGVGFKPWQAELRALSFLTSLKIQSINETAETRFRHQSLRTLLICFEMNSAITFALLASVLVVASVHCGGYGGYGYGHGHGHYHVSHAKIAKVHYVKTPIVSTHYVKKPVVSYIHKPVKSVHYVSKPVVSLHSVPVISKSYGHGW